MYLLKTLGLYQTFLKEIKEDLKKWKAICVRGLEDLVLLEWQCTPNLPTD